MGDENSRSITNIKQYLEWIEETVEPVEPIGHYAFRGQEEATWSLECGAALRLRKSYDSQSEEEAQQRWAP